MQYNLIQCNKSFILAISVILVILKICVNVPLQISRGIFEIGDIIQMQTIHESNYIVIKQPCNGNSKMKRRLVVQNLKMA